MLKTLNTTLIHQALLSKSSKANINDPLVISEEIIASNDDSTRFLINADKLFLTESFQQVKSSYPSWYKGFKLGSLSKDKTRYSEINNYPENTDVIVDYVYEKINILQKRKFSSN